MQTPMEKHVNKLLSEIEEKETEILKIKNTTDEMMKHLNNDAYDQRHSCGKCHKKGHCKIIVGVPMSVIPCLW